MNDINEIIPPTPEPRRNRILQHLLEYRNRILQHLLEHQSFWIWMPVAILVAMITRYAVKHSGGILDDTGPLWGWCMNALAAVVVVVLTCALKPHLFDDIDTRTLIDRAEKSTSSSFVWFCLFRTILDSLESIGLLVFFGFIMWH